MGRGKIDYNTYICIRYEEISIIYSMHTLDMLPIDIVNMIALINIYSYRSMLLYRKYAIYALSRMNMIKSRFRSGRRDDGPYSLFVRTYLDGMLHSFNDCPATLSKEHGCMTYSWYNYGKIYRDNKQPEIIESFPLRLTWNYGAGMKRITLYGISVDLSKYRAAAAVIFKYQYNISEVMEEICTGSVMDYFRRKHQITHVFANHRLCPTGCIYVDDIYYWIYLTCDPDPKCDLSKKFIYVYYGHPEWKGYLKDPERTILYKHSIPGYFCTQEYYIAP